MKIDIDRWGSPVASQFAIDRLPTLWLYEDGQRVSQDTRDVLGRLEQQ